MLKVPDKFSPTPRKFTKEIFDLQVNGYAGVDFQNQASSAAIRHACERLRHDGVTRILATMITQPASVLHERLAAIQRYRDDDELIRETIVGYHLEGPHLSEEEGYRGAHPAELMTDPDWPEFLRFQESAGGLIRLVTIAPERESAAEFIENASRSGVRISLGHTNANDNQIDAAIAAGATLCTHLGNGCPRCLPRHDNIIQRLLARDELTACVIPDGIHLPPGVLRNLYRAKPCGKVILTSDAMSAAGAGPGQYTLGTLQMDVGEDAVVRMPGSEYFAGSALRLTHGIADAADWLGIGINDAAEMASAIPAAALGLNWKSDSHEY